MFHRDPETSNFVKNSSLRVVFLTLLLMFGYPDETLSLVFDILLIAWVNLNIQVMRRIYLLCQALKFVAFLELGAKAQRITIEIIHFLPFRIRILSNTR